jgi:DivIVA domain-containing protein
MVPTNYAHYVHRVRFRRRLLGYHPADVRRHLDIVSGWFSLAGLEGLLDERVRALADQAERRVDEAQREATRIVAQARQEAAAIRRNAREEARATLEQARREAALERRGRSRVGRPVGARSDPR